MDPIVQAEQLLSAIETLKDSTDVGNRVVTLAADMKRAAGDFLKLRATATSDEGQAVFDARLEKAIAAVKENVVLTAEQKAVIRPFLEALLS